MKRFKEKKILLLMCLIQSMFLFNMAFGANITWTGGGTDNLASNGANWSGGKAPVNGDRVTFDSGSKYCTWDLSVTLASMTKTAGYTGKVHTPVTSTVEISKVNFWTNGGSNNLASNPSNWSKGTIPVDGEKIVFNNSSLDNCTWDIIKAPGLFSINTDYTGSVSLNNNLSVTGHLLVGNGVLDLNNMALTVDGYILIGSAGTLNGRSSIITLKGDWANAGTFIPGTSTVVLTGTGQAIYGSTTFYNLTKTVTAADTLYFQSGETQTVTNSLTLTGVANDLLTLTCEEEKQGQACTGNWYLDPRGTRNLAYVSTKYLKNKAFDNIATIHSTDGGNNYGVQFGGSECIY